jgi:hypothetical protein
VKKRPSTLRYIPSPQTPVIIGSTDEILLDPDFDDTEEVVLFEPPIMATRRCGGHLIRLDEEKDDDENS